MLVHVLNFLLLASSPSYHLLFHSFGVSDFHPHDVLLNQHDCARGCLVFSLASSKRAGQLLSSWNLELVVQNTF